jgi:hypothetical protein
VAAAAAKKAKPSAAVEQVRYAQVRKGQSGTSQQCHSQLWLVTPSRTGDDMTSRHDDVAEHGTKDGAQGCASSRRT